MTLSTVERMLYENDQSYIYRVLEENVIGLSLEPGAGISETELSQIFKSSRSPIRGALSRLKEEGLVIIEPQKKTTVAKFDADFIRQAGYVRYTIETNLILDIIRDNKQDALCDKLEIALNDIPLYDGDESTETESNIRKADELFHYKIYEMAGREKLYQCLHKPYIHLRRMQSLQRIREFRDGDFVFRHEKLIYAIRDKDLNAIENRKNISMQRLNAVISDAMEKFPHYFC